MKIFGPRSWCTDRAHRGPRAMTKGPHEPYDKYMLFTGWEVRIGKNCARGLEYAAEGRTQGRGHSFSSYEPITYLFFSAVFLKMKSQTDWQKVFLSAVRRTVTAEITL